MATEQNKTNTTMESKTFNRGSVATKQFDFEAMGIDLSVLSETEENILRTAILPKGTPFIQGAPGSAKTAILEAIAAKIGYNYVDLRLPSQDELQIGLYPIVRKRNFMIDGVETELEQVSNAYPEWVGDLFNPNIKGTILVLEELNRAAKPVLDASMNILLEKRIGKVEFPTNCLVFATGNLGDDDGTDVQELDTAMISGRLIPIKHELLFKDWVKDYAEGKIHPDIISFLNENPNRFYPDIQKQLQREQGGILITARSWSQLSSMIVANYGMQSTVEEYGKLLDKHGKGLVGQEYLELKKFLMSQNRLTIRKVLDGVYKVADYKKASRENKSAVIAEISGVEKDMTDKEFKNLVKFLKEVNKDELVNVLTKELDINGLSLDRLKIIRNNFKEEVETILEKL